MADELDRVVPLDELEDYTVAEGDPDVRGWDVLSADGRKIGEVENLLIDTAAMKVRYLEVNVANEIVQGGEHRHILIPIGYARLHEDDDQVLVDALDSKDVMGLPEYQQEPLTREYESSVRERFDSAFTPTSAEDPGFYAGRGFDEQSFFGTRRTDAGDAGSSGGVRRTSGMRASPAPGGEVDPQRSGPTTPGSIPGSDARLGEDDRARER